MKSYSISYARKVLGKAAEGVSDEQLQKDIDAAHLLKDLFFDEYKRSRTHRNSPPNVP